MFCAAGSAAGVETLAVVAAGLAAAAVVGAAAGGCVAAGGAVGEAGAEAGPQAASTPAPAAENSNTSAERRVTMRGWSMRSDIKICSPGLGLNITRLYAVGRARLSTHQLPGLSR